MPFPTIAEAAADLAAGRTTSVSLVEGALSRIADPAGEGARAFIAVQADQARASAAAMDALRAAGRAPGPWAGIPISIKDLYDQKGVVTRGGSVALDDAAPAEATAVSVARLERAGFVVLGRTNMTEFAFSGLGVNPHYGTPLSPWDRATGRIPGGSSAGAAVATADGMGFAGLGSDTGGSCRIPAALCGIVGWKPTARRVPLTGTLPLSFTLDSLGPLARSVACCALLDSIMAGEEPQGTSVAPNLPMPVAGLRLGVLQGYVTEGWDATVTASFERALSTLSAAGARIGKLTVPELVEIPAAMSKANFAASEAWAWHRDLVARKAASYDPRILGRIRRGEAMAAADYVVLMQERARLIAAIAARTADFDAVVMPTCPVVPPALMEVEDEAEYGRINLLLLRNTTIGNFLDRCAISLPCHRAGEPPVGFMLMGETMGDARLLDVARAVEAALA
ncbi:amidase [Falsiroseomonas sp. HW251]|uniref:amidase n=1 Tax=Falsiroseomonas sp. HW251 TaxID=3390998 RepID=UPI003D3108B7